MESISVQHFRDFYCRIWPPGVFELSKNAKKNRKIKVTSSLFIIYLHIELQTCRGSWSLLVCSYMATQVAFLTKSLSACCTFKWFHTCMCSHMCSQVAFLTKSLSACFTSIWTTLMSCILCRSWTIF